MRRAEKEKKKNFTSEFRLNLTWSRKFRKKLEKLKKPLSDINFNQNGLRQALNEKKKNLLPNSVHTRPKQEKSEKNSKKIEKIKKTSFRHYFLPKWDEIGREREKKNFTSEFRSCSTEARKFRKKQQKN